MLRHVKLSDKAKYILTIGVVTMYVAKGLSFAGSLEHTINNAIDAANTLMKK